MLIGKMFNIFLTLRQVSIFITYIDDDDFQLEISFFPILCVNFSCKLSFQTIFGTISTFSPL